MRNQVPLFVCNKTIVMDCACEVCSMVYYILLLYGATIGSLTRNIQNALLALMQVCMHLYTVNPAQYHYC
jgi:hypothetical protein